MQYKPVKRIFFDNTRKIFYLVATVIFVLLTALAAHMAWLRTSREARAQALLISDTIALTLNIDLFKDLTISLDDLQNENYQILKNKFEKLPQTDKNIRFVYIFKFIDDRLFFVVDSEPATSEDYSPPGQEYTEATEEYVNRYKTGDSFITPAVTDRWGTWITVVTPIKDNAGNDSEYYLCLDYPYDVFYKKAVANTIELTTIVASLLLLIFTIINIILKGKDVKKNRENFRILSQLTFEGILIHKNGFAVDFNDSLCNILNAKREEMLDNYMLDYVHPDDRATARANMAIEYSRPYTVRMVRRTGEPFVAELEGKNIMREGEPLRMVAIRDVTERYNENQKLIESYKRYDELSRQSQTFTWEVNADGLYVDVNDAVLDVTGYTADELINKKYYYDLCPDPDMVKAQVSLAFAEKLPIVEFVNAIVKKNGELIWVLTNALPIFDKNQYLNGYKGSDRNITEKKLLEEKVLNEREWLKTTLISVGDGVIATDTDGKITLINRVAESITGWKEKEALGMDFEQVFNIISEKNRRRRPNPIKQVIKSGKIIELANHTLLITKNGDEVPIEDSAAPIRDQSGNITGVVLVFRDFTDKKEKLERIEYLSYHDQLTGLYNRRYFEEEMLNLDCDENYPLTLALLDINGLKLINDAFGHLAGDRALQIVSILLEEIGNRYNASASRIGGDEFVMLLPRKDYAETEKIINLIEKEVVQHKINGINLSVSYGWCTKYEKDDKLLTELFSKAEDEMYSQKLSESQSMRHRAIDIIMQTLFEKNSREESHSKRVSSLAEKVGQALGLREQEINELKSAGLLHDIGKITIPDEILNKSGALTEEDLKTIRKHSETGYKILSSVNEFANIALCILQHHERMDGTGYPMGISGDEIKLYSRIISIADAYDAMTTDRPYRRAMSRENAIAELIKHSGTQFDEELVKIFIDIVQKESIGYSAL